MGGVLGVERAVNMRIVRVSSSEKRVDGFNEFTCTEGVSSFCQ